MRQLRRSAFYLLLLVLLGTGLARPAAAMICTIDDVPAATLLLPYFEVDLSNPDGVTTWFSVNNASPKAVLAHVVIWSDLSVPVLGFDLYLTGYDAQTINLRDILVGGTLPQTASQSQDPQDTISPQGEFSEDVNFASCVGQLPPPPLPPSFVQHLQSSLTGQASPLLGNRCAGRNLGDDIARGYVTVDTVKRCTLQGPSDRAYFAGGRLAVATDDNVLWGDYSYFYPDHAHGGTLVHIEASAEEPETTSPGHYTFYGRYVGWNALDHREALATIFAGRFASAGAFTGGTDVICWRDSKINQGPFNCPVVPFFRPFWHPLFQEGVVFFDEEESPALYTSFPTTPQGPITGPRICPASTQRARVGSTSFPLPDGVPVPFDFGWLYLNLNTTIPGSPVPPEDPAAAQAWVIMELEATGRFSIGFDGMQLDSACNALHSIPPPQD